MGNVAHCQHVRLRIKRSTVRLPRGSMIFAYPHVHVCTELTFSEIIANSDQEGYEAIVRLRGGAVEKLQEVLTTLGELLQTFVSFLDDFRSFHSFIDNCSFQKAAQGQRIPGQHEIHG